MSTGIFVGKYKQIPAYCSKDRLRFRAESLLSEGRKDLLQSGILLRNLAVFYLDSLVDKSSECRKRDTCSFC